MTNEHTWPHHSFATGMRKLIMGKILAKPMSLMPRQRRNRARLGFLFLIKHRRILWATFVNDLRAKYMVTALGWLWMLLYPLLFLGLYSVVYILIFAAKIQGETSTTYVLLIFSGLVPFLGFAEALGNGVNSVVANQNLVRNTLFPIELVPIKSVLVSGVGMSVSFSILLVALWAKGIASWTQALLPIVIIMQLMLTCGIVWILSALNVLIRDIGQTVAIVTLFLMLVSPIAYTVDMVPERVLPFMYLNPLFFLIQVYRQTLYVGSFNETDLLVLAVVSVVTFQLGYFVFSRMKDIFLDAI